MGLNDVSQARNMQSGWQRAKTRTESPQYPYFTSHDPNNPNRFESDGFTITLDKRELKEKDGKKYWNCKFTLYNQDRWVYTSFTKSYKNEDGTFSRLNPSFTDTFTHLIKPMNVSAFMDWGSLSDIVTNPKEALKTIVEEWDEAGKSSGEDEYDDPRVVRFFAESWDVFANIGRAWRGEETKITTFDKTILKDVEFSFYDNNEHLLIMGPKGNDQLLMFNFLKIFFQPVMEMILGAIVDGDGYKMADTNVQLFADSVEKLFSDVELETTYKMLAIVNDPVKSWKDKFVELWPQLYQKFGDYLLHDLIIGTISEKVIYDKLKIEGKGYDDPTIKAIFGIYNNIILKGGDMLLFTEQCDYEGFGIEMTQGLEQFEPDPICTPAEAIDLGLTSGTLWASYNVGATSTTESGDTFAWGEIEPKDLEKLLGDTFTDYELWNTYKWCSDGNYQTVTKYHSIDNKTILDLEDDAAHYKWGGSWRMPTYDELKELLDECDSEWIPNHDVSGWWLTGPNGNKIFLPSGLYWTSELAAQNKAFVLKATINGLSRSADVRPWTNRVRPMYVKE